MPGTCRKDPSPTRCLGEPLLSKMGLPPAPTPNPWVVRCPWQWGPWDYCPSLQGGLASPQGPPCPWCLRTSVGMREVGAREGQGAGGLAGTEAGMRTGRRASGSGARPER